MTLQLESAPIDVGNNPNSIVSGDFNGDGRPDLAVADQDDDDVSILLQDQDRHFELLTDPDDEDEIRTFKVGESPAALLAVDIDGDGLLDLLTANRAGESVTFLEGNGDGTFKDLDETDGLSDSPIRDEADSMALAQFNDDNGDSQIDDRDFFDLVVANRDANTAAVLFGDGKGNFSRTDDAGTVQPVGDRPNAIAVGQFDDDNADGIINDLDFLDVAAANIGSDVSVLLGRGGGLLREEIRVILADQPEPIVSGDFNNDGIFDLATANITSNDVSIRLGLANGGFGEEILVAVGAAPQSITVGHFNDDNGDGKRDDEDRLDLAVANRSDDNVSVLIQRIVNCSRPICFDPTPFSPFSVGDAPVSIVAGQFSDDNADEVIDSRDFFDIATSNLFGDSISILLGESHGSFRKALELPAGTEPVSILATQLTDDDGDGVISDSDTLDLATANRGSHDVSIWVGNGDGSFDEFDRIPVGRSPVSIISDDWNGDGRPDLATADSASAEVSILLLLGPGDGRFVLQDGNGFSSPLNSTPLPGDLDDDRIRDVVILDQSGNILFRKEGLPVGRIHLRMFQSLGFSTRPSCLIPRFLHAI